MSPIQIPEEGNYRLDMVSGEVPSTDSKGSISGEESQWEAQDQVIDRPHCPIIT